MILDIVTPERRVQSFDKAGLKLPCEVKSVKIPGAKGQFEILPGHSPLLATLGTGILQFEDQAGKTTSLMVSGGFCEINLQKVNILCHTAALAEEVNKDEEKRVLNELENEQTGLINKHSYDEEKMSQLRNKIKQASNKVQL